MTSKNESTVARAKTKAAMRNIHPKVAKPHIYITKAERALIGSESQRCRGKEEITHGATGIAKNGKALKRLPRDISGKG